MRRISSERIMKSVEMAGPSSPFLIRTDLDAAVRQGMIGMDLRSPSVVILQIHDPRPRGKFLDKNPTPIITVGFHPRAADFDHRR
jgi:hypothetical protein